MRSAVFAAFAIAASAASQCKTTPSGTCFSNPTGNLASLLRLTLSAPVAVEARKQFSASLMLEALASMASAVTFASSKCVLRKF